MPRTPRGRGTSNKVYSELESAVAPPGVPRSLSTATNGTRTAQSPANRRRSSRAKLSPHTHGVAIASVLASPGEWFQTVDGLQENVNFSRAETVLNKVAREKRLSLADDNSNVRLYQHPSSKQKNRGRRKAGVNPSDSKETKDPHPAPEGVVGDTEMPHNKRARRKAAVDAVENIKKDAQTKPERDYDSEDLLPYNPRKRSGGILVDGEGARSAQSSPPTTIKTFVPRGKVEERWLRNFNKWRTAVSEQSESKNSPLPKRWVQDQRSQYRQLQQNKKSQLTRDRIALLEAAGFNWVARKNKSPQTKDSAAPSDEKESNGVDNGAKRSEIAASRTSEKRRSPRLHSAKPKAIGIATTSRPQNAQSELSTLQADASLQSKSCKSKSAADRKRKRGGRHSMSSLSMIVSDEGTKRESYPLSKRELDEQLIKMKRISKRRSEGAAKRKQKEKERPPKETLPQTELNEIGDAIAMSRTEKPSPPQSPLLPSELLTAYGSDRLSKPSGMPPEVKDTAPDNFDSVGDAKESEQVSETNVTKLLVSCLSEDSAERLTAELMQKNPPSPNMADEGEGKCVPKSNDTFPSNDQEVGDSHIPNEETKIPKQVTRWTCDVCNVATFDTCEEAEAHEKTCSFGQEFEKNAEPDMDDTPSTEAASSPPLDGTSQKHSTDNLTVEGPAMSNKIVRASQPLDHSQERLQDFTDRADSLRELPLRRENDSAGASVARYHPRNVAQLELTATSELHDEKMAEAGRLELASKMVSQRMREIELEMRRIDSDRGPASHYADDRPRRRHHHVEEFETITHRRSYRTESAASSSIHEGWPRRRYDSESDGQYCDGPYYSMKRRGHMSDRGPRYYPGHEPIRRRSETYDHSGRRGFDPREDDYSDDYGARGDRGSPRTRGRRSSREYRDEQHEARPSRSRSRDRAYSPHQRRGGRRRHRPPDDGYFSEDGLAVARSPSRRSGKRPGAEVERGGDSPGRRSPERRRKRSTPPPSSSRKKKRKGRTTPSSGRGKRLSPLKRGKMSSLELAGLDNGLVLSEVADGEPDVGSGGSDADGGEDAKKPGDPFESAAAGGGEEGLADDSDEDTWSDGFTLLLPPPPA